MIIREDIQTPHFRGTGYQPVDGDAPKTRRPAHMACLTKQIGALSCQAFSTFGCPCDKLSLSDGVCSL